MIHSLWLLFTAAFLLAAGSVSLHAQSLRITWVGQSCFYIQTSDGSGTVVTDPPTASVGYALPDTSANAVTISHNHTDHNFSQGVKGTFTLVDGRPVTARTEVNAAGLTFVQIPGFHDNTNGSARGPNTLIRWTQAGLRLAHMGDYGQDQLTPEQLADLRDLDVLFVAAGGFFTPDAKAISAQIAQIAPRVAILMHYKTALGGPAQLAQVPAVAAGFNGAVQYKPSSLTLSRATLPPTPEVWLMEPVGDLVAVNPGSYAAGIPVGAGSIASIFGNFANSKTGAFTAFPLPRKIEDTEVLVDGTPAPIFFVSPGQINLQAPTVADTQSVVEVRVAGQRVARGAMNIVKSAPGILIALNQDGRLNTTVTPARRGQVLSLYATGLGDSTPTLPDGFPGPALPPALAAQLPTATVGGATATPYYAALAPGLVGIWRVDLIIPATAAQGNAVPVSLKQGFTSADLPVAIQ